jgi:predicted RNase H-like nuclease (RuvC/YqgF family)
VSGLKKRLEDAHSSAEELKAQIVDLRNKAEEAKAETDKAERQIRKGQADMADMQRQAEVKMAELARTIGEMENSLRLAEERSQALEKEVGLIHTLNPTKQIVQVAMPSRRQWADSLIFVSAFEPLVTKFLVATGFTCE